MGCDIHIIVEIKQNDKWTFIEDLPNTFDCRNYGLFSILNTNVRNYYGINGFSPRGLPKDLSIKKCFFESQKEQLVNMYESCGEIVCVLPNGEFIDVFDESLQVEIPLEKYNELKNNNEKDNERYHYSIKSIKDDKYYVQDASVVNGKFEKRKYSEIFKTLSEFNEKFYRFTPVGDDFGYYSVDFDADYLYGHSYLTLGELRKKNVPHKNEEHYEIDKNFYNHLIEELEVLPEVFVVGKDKGDNLEIIWSQTPEKSWAYRAFAEGIEELEQIKKKYGIENDEDIRIVFAFDS